MSDVWTPAYVALGSNLDDPLRQVRQGFDALATLPRTRLIARSRLVRSAPMGPQDQPEYVNAAAGLLTQLRPEALLDELKKLEAQLGRSEPIVRWGPRVIDFDLLLYGDVRMQSDALTLPHPGIASRNFVLLPLADIAPDLMIPGVGRVAQLAAGVGSAGLTVIA